MIKDSNVQKIILQKKCSLRGNENYEDYLKASVVEMTVRLQTLDPCCERYQIINQTIGYYKTIINHTNLREFERRRVINNYAGQNSYDSIPFERLA